MQRSAGDTPKPAYACLAALFLRHQASRYTRGEMQLEPGVSEAGNPAEEEWGEAALIETARAGRDNPPFETVRIIMDAADQFANGTPQHDDMTLVVAKVLDHPGVWARVNAIE